MDKQELAPSPEPRQWTSIDAYLPGVLHRRLVSRRLRRPRPRTQPDVPNPMLSTLPFLALFGVLAMLFLAIATMAWPQGQGQGAAEPEAAGRELGTAPRGWFQAAEKEFAAQPAKRGGARAAQAR